VIACGGVWHRLSHMHFEVSLPRASGDSPHLHYISLFSLLPFFTAIFFSPQPPLDMEEGPSHNNNNEVADGMQCIHHPHRTNNNNNTAAICAFCLQEKLGKLLSSSFPSPPSVKTKNNKPPTTSSNSSSSGSIIFKRSKSTRTHAFIHHDHDFSPRKKNGFWSFLYPSSKSPNGGKQRQKCLGVHTQRKSDHVIMEEDKCLSSSSSKVSRSRSVGCGSRSFSADFFERISSGLGDCTLRRVESRREGKPAGVVNHCMKERVRCGGIFGGFAVTSSSSSASSSSWVSSTVDDGRGRSWGWALASPIRAFTTKASSSSSSSKRDASDNIPSLLTVRGWTQTMNKKRKRECFGGFIFVYAHYHACSSSLIYIVILSSSNFFSHYSFFSLFIVLVEWFFLLWSLAIDYEILFLYYATIFSATYVPDELGN